MRGGRRRWIGAAALLVALVGCSAPPQAADPTAPTAGPSSGSTSPTPALAFDPAASTDIYLPGGTSEVPGAPTPVIVLVPGGGWVTHDRSGFTTLAQELADAGYAVANTEYRAGADDVRFPTPVRDVFCSAAYAVAELSREGVVPGPVVLVGHSAGGHLAALVAVSGTRLRRPCTDPVPEISGLVGLAGIYDTRAFSRAMTDFFGGPPSAHPSLWDAGDPVHYAEAGAVPPGLHVLLVHGTKDDVVPLSQSKSFALALKAADVDVDLLVLPGEDHTSVIAPGVVGSRLLAWLASWAPAPPWS